MRRKREPVDNEMRGADLIACLPAAGFLSGYRASLPTPGGKVAPGRQPQGRSSRARRERIKNTPRNPSDDFS